MLDNIRCSAKLGSNNWNTTHHRFGDRKTKPLSGFLRWRHKNVKNARIAFRFRNRTSYNCIARIYILQPLLKRVVIRPNI